MREYIRYSNIDYFSYLPIRHYSTYAIGTTALIDEYWDSNVNTVNFARLDSVPYHI